MNFQEKMFENTAQLRDRAAAFATMAIASASARAKAAAMHVQVLRGSLGEFNKVARRHAARFVKTNSSLAVDATKDVSALARATYATLAEDGMKKRGTSRPAKRAAPKTPASRKRAASKAA
jgi:hypothetical protein